MPSAVLYTASVVTNAPTTNVPIVGTTPGLGRSVWGTMRKQITWRNLNATCAALSFLLWGVATWTDWVASVRFISHISMLTMIFTFIAAWRADVPDG